MADTTFVLGTVIPVAWLNDVNVATYTTLPLKASLISPSFTTPTLGVATATSINKITFTQPASSAVLTIANGKTFTASNTLTITGTDGSTLNMVAGGTLHASVYTSTYTTGGVLVGNGVSAFTVTTAGTTGQILTSTGAGSAPTFQTPVGSASYLKVSDQKANGTDGGASLAADITQTRVLNTVETNMITGASLATNTVTLPAGTFQFRIRAPAHGQAGSHKAFLYNTSDSTYTGIGSNASAVTGTSSMSDSTISGQFTIAGAKNFTVRHYTTSSNAVGLGFAISSSKVEVYTEAEFWKVA